MTDRLPSLVYSRRLKLLLFAELFLIFFGMPLLYYLGLITIPPIPALLGLTIVCITVLWYDDSFNLAKEFRKKIHYEKLVKICLRFLFLGSLLAFSVWLFYPERFLYMPLNNTSVWVILMFLYPVLSAFPQEMIYRTFLFHRYKRILSRGWLLTFVSVVAFAFLHIIYENWVSILLTLAGGYLFTKTYKDTGSIWLTTIEHSLYGCLVFTLGLGIFFYSGA